MFDNDMFEKWLESQSQEIVDKMGQGAQLRTEEMMILVLKAQSNHFHHLDKDLRNEMITLRTDMRDEMKTLRVDFQHEMKTLREDMNQRFESVDKRFEQVIRRMDRFMFWSIGITVAAAAFVVNYLQ